VKSTTALTMFLNGAAGPSTATAGTVNHNAARATRIRRKEAA
jgi:hypothetical protein